MIWLALAGMWLVGVSTGWHLHAIRKLRRRYAQPIDLTGMSISSHTGHRTDGYSIRVPREWFIGRSKGDE